jgi:hypothetical protein
MVQDATTAPTTEQGAARLRRVAPPDRRRESAAVARLALLVAVVALLWIGRRGAGLGRGDELLPWQVPFASLPSVVQRQVRELHEACDEALRFRGDQGRWPTVAELAADGIAPFADGATTSARASVPYVWQYAAKPAKAGGARPLLLQLLEPRPGDTEGSDPRAPVVEDETHRKLADGTLLHVAFWIGPERECAIDRYLADPAVAGWQQVMRDAPARRGE